VVDSFDSLDMEGSTFVPLESMAGSQRLDRHGPRGRLSEAPVDRWTSPDRSNGRMPEAPPVSRTSPRTTNGRKTREINRAVVGDIDRLRRDAGIGVRRLANEAGLDPGYLSQVFAGSRSPSTAVLVALTTVLGADLSVRVYPTTGPIVRDSIQARIGEELLRMSAASWRKSVEVAVYRPARGFIDIVFDEPIQMVAVATEIQSRIDRLEQQIRWAQDKALSLPSSEMWRFLSGEPSISRLLVLRSTAATREIARRFQATLAAAYPATTRDVFAALTTPGAPWPGPGILWADVRGDDVRVLERPPRGVALGR
jgi:transcriptional regulator with XRE-family HTH domain